MLPTMSLLRTASTSQPLRLGVVGEHLAAEQALLLPDESCEDEGRAKLVLGEDAGAFHHGGHAGGVVGLGAGGVGGDVHASVEPRLSRWPWMMITRSGSVVPRWMATTSTTSVGCG